MGDTVQSGQCLCGAVTMVGHGEPKLAICHCQTCRRWHGGPALSVRFTGGLKITSGVDTLGWYDSSEWAERGFCRTCGATLFYRLKAPSGDISIDLMGESGHFDLPDGLEIEEHFFIDEKPDFYDFTDDAPRLTGAEVFERFSSEDR